MVSFAFKVGGSLFLAALVAWFFHWLGVSSTVLYAGENLTLRLGVAAFAAVFLLSFWKFNVKS